MGNNGLEELEEQFIEGEISDEEFDKQLSELDQTAFDRGDESNGYRFTILELVEIFLSLLLFATIIVLAVISDGLLLGPLAIFLFAAYIVYRMV